MTRPRSSAPVSSFAPELMALLLQGATKAVELRLPYRGAVALSARINRLRSQMRRESHPMADMATRSQVKLIIDEDTPCRVTGSRNRIPRDPEATITVRVCPQDEAFSAVIRAAGVDPTLGSDFIRPEPRTAKSPPVLDTFLDRLLSETPDDERLAKKGTD